MRIGIIGAGAAGLTASWLLSENHDVTLYEKQDRLGGHAHTVFHDGLALDVGFLVHNEPNYPLLVRLFRELGNIFVSGLRQPTVDEMMRIYCVLRANFTGTLRRAGASSPFKARVFRDLCVLASAAADELVTA